MSRKTYKLNEEDVVSENREVLQTKKDGKLTLVLHPASKKAIDVYDGDKLVSKKMNIYSLGEYTDISYGMNGNVYLLRGLDGKSVVCFSKSGKIIFDDVPLKMERKKDIDNETYFFLKKNNRVINIFDADGNECLDGWYEYADALSNNLFVGSTYGAAKEDGKFFNKDRNLVYEGANVDPTGGRVVCGDGEEFIVIAKVDKNLNAIVRNLMTKNGKVLLDEWVNKDIKSAAVDVNKGKLRKEADNVVYICSMNQNPHKASGRYFKLYKYDKDKEEAIKITDEIVTQLDRKYIVNSDIVIAWNDNQKMNILSTDGFVFDEFIDQIYIPHIGINLEDWQDDFLKSGLIVCENDGKYNLVENFTKVKVLDSFVKSVVHSENPFTPAWSDILIKYHEDSCDIASLSDLKTEFDGVITDIFKNSYGYIFFSIGENTYLYLNRDKYIKCEDCYKSYYGVCIKKKNGYIFEFNGRYSDVYDNVYDIDNLFPTIEKLYIIL